MITPDKYQKKAILLAVAKLMKTRLKQGNAPMDRKKLAAVREKIGALAPVIDPLVWLQPDREQDSSHLNNEILQEILRGEQLGVWALCAHSLNHLERVIAERRPSCILEMGSGISTLALQVFCRPLREAGHEVHIFSVEQGEDYAAQTRERLALHGLEKGATVVVCPLRKEQGPDGREIHSYDFSSLPSVMNDEAADFLLIDGPFGPPGSRVEVLPELIRLKSLAPKAHFLMDDALRDGEMWIYDIWAKRKDVKLDGVYWVGKGFLSGELVG